MQMIPHLQMHTRYAVIRYADDTTLTAESKEKLKNLFMSVKGESQKAGLKLNIKIRKN